MKYLLTVIYIFFTTGGITFMKLGGDSLKLGLKDGFSFSMGWKTFVGFLFYLISFLLWQKMIVKYDLSIMVPIVTGIVQIVVLLIGYIIFKEQFNIVSLIGAILIIVGIIWITLAERRIQIQYANHTAGIKSSKSSYLPIKINSAGVMPVIFASILLTIPVTIAGLIGKKGAITFINKYIVYTTPTGFVLYCLLILLFGYFWTFLQMNPEELAKDLNKRGGYIPGIRPGSQTVEYVSKSLSKLTLVGSIFLVVLAGIPIIFSKVSGLSSQITIGGTGILIVVGVAIETYKQIESGLVSRNYGRMGRRK